MVKLGRRYRDNVHGIEGVAHSRTEFLHGCARVRLEFVKDGELKSEVFDEPQLVDPETGENAYTGTKTGGDRPAPGKPV